MTEPAVGRWDRRRDRRSVGRLDHPVTEPRYGRPGSWPASAASVLRIRGTDLHATRVWRASDASDRHHGQGRRGRPPSRRAAFDTPRNQHLLSAAVPPPWRSARTGSGPGPGPSVRLTLDGAEPYDYGSAPRAVTPRRCTL